MINYRILLRPFREMAAILKICVTERNFVDTLEFSVVQNLLLDTKFIEIEAEEH